MSWACSEHVAAHDVFEQELVALVQAAKPLEKVDAPLHKGDHLGFPEPEYGYSTVAG